MNLRALLLISATLFFLTQISALCEEGQIDINSAPVEELDQLYGIGLAKAKAIIDSRIELGPFSSVDELIRVNGIKEATLANIKSHTPSACVGEEEIIEENNEKNSSNINEQPAVSDIKSEESSPRETELEAINLNPQAIKSDAGSSVSDRGNYAIYGLFAFVVLLGLLFLIRGMKRRKEKNELE